ncbi:MAG: hypothetical protein IPN17_35780 [Deltaproteobacteria bacterium]|nr:hypothetical protein [Deltaproteobacteria bacterium]
MSELRDAIGILRETKNKWERRVPLVPQEVRGLVAGGIAVRVERSPTRAIEDAEFAAAGATLVDDATDCRFIIGVKEVKASQVKPGQAVMCFSHTIKGQSHNMPLLAHFMKQGATLIDYEVIVDDAGVRQVAFGRYAGLAGAHETLWTLGHRLAALGHPSTLSGLRHAVEYHDLAEMVAHTRELLAELRKEGPEALAPFVVAVTGEGRVSQGRWSTSSWWGRSLHGERGHRAADRLARRPHAAGAAREGRRALRDGGHEALRLRPLPREPPSATSTSGRCTCRTAPRW